MSLLDFLEKLQDKPRHIKVAILWTGVAVFMTAVFVFWVWTLDINRSSEKISSLKEAAEIKSLSEIKKEAPSLWQSLKAGAADMLESLKQKSESGQEEVNQPKVEIESGEQNNAGQVPPAQLP